VQRPALALLLLFSSGQTLRGTDAIPPENPWRSALYPKDWTPSWTDSEGRFLHDFSYAGYHRGEKSWPDSLSSRVIRVTEAPYFADATGQSNAAPAIQKAIDDTAAQGGGTVMIPNGRYRLDFQPQEKAALRIRASHVVLRGEGAGTQLFTRETMMRDKTLILAAPAVPSWRQPANTASIPLIEDSRERDVTIKLQSVAGLAAGDSLVIRADVTPDFARELDMEGDWDTRVEGPHFYREIKAIDPVTGLITLDVPLRFPLKTRDSARVHKVAPPLVEVGVANLVLGMAEQTLPGLSEDDFDKPGTAGYQAHRAFLLRFVHVQHSWIQGVRSFAIEDNKGGFHTQSGGIALHQVRFVTVDDTEMAFPQYKGAGGNGYLYELQNAQEVLVQNTKARGGRHNFDVKSMGSSGLVFLKCLARDGVLTSDFHMYLSQAVLFDSMQVDGDQLEAKFRDSGTIKHGQTTTQSVFWNTIGQRYMPGRSTIVHSQQWGLGYVIGTQGPASKVANPGGRGTEPKDWVEGAGQGQLLDPPSLYEDQLRRRLSAARVSLQKE
jgi:hypothetical protein